MKYQRIRNLTTGLMHTNIRDIKEDIAYLVGAKYTSSATISKSNKALYPFLEARLSDRRFFNKTHDEEHTGDIEILPLDEVEMKLFVSRYKAFCRGEQP